MAQPYAVVPSHFNPTVYEAIEAADNVLFFQWDLTADTFQLREHRHEHRYALPPRFSRASTKLTLEGMIHPDDTSILEYYLHRLYHNHPGNRAHNHLRARLRLRSSKKPLWLWSEVNLITYYNGQQPAMAFGNIRNIQAEKLLQERIFRRANTDDLTGLLSKGAGKSQIRSALRQLSPQKDTATLLIVDADDFKAVNDTFGHLFGDKVLREIGLSIQKNFRQSDIKGRIGGDEFIIFLPGMSNVDVLARHCQALCRRLSRVFHCDGKHQSFSISIGAAQYPVHGQSYRELFAHADQALYEAKRCGKGQYVLYQPNMSEPDKDSADPPLLSQSAAAENNQLHEESIADLQKRVQYMQGTIDSMWKMICVLLNTKI